LLVRKGGVGAAAVQPIIRLWNSSLDPDGSTARGEDGASPAAGGGEICTALNGALTDSASHEIDASIMIWLVLQ
jgi:hypothetical protein